MPINVLSLFDGASCGRLALGRIGIPVARYTASEIDRNALFLSKKRYPDIVHLGCATKVKAKDVGDVDLLIGGPPCQSFSIAGKGQGFKDSRGLLLLEFVRLLNELKPQWFLMENVRMKRDCEEEVSRLLGVGPVVFNSSLLSAQDRVRLYWTNIPFRLPKPKGLVLADILQGLSKGWPKQDHMSEPTRTGFVNKGGQGDRIYSPYGKGITLSASSGGTAGPANMLVGYQDCWRKLSVVEAERLQTMPDSYTDVRLPRQARRKLIGNAWTVDVIAWILKGIMGK